MFPDIPEEEEEEEEPIPDKDFLRRLIAFLQSDRFGEYMKNNKVEMDDVRSMFAGRETSPITTSPESYPAPPPTAEALMPGASNWMNQQGSPALTGPPPNPNIDREIYTGPVTSSPFPAFERGTVEKYGPSGYRESPPSPTRQVTENPELRIPELSEFLNSQRRNSPPAGRNIRSGSNRPNRNLPPGRRGR